MQRHQIHQRFVCGLLMRISHINSLYNYVCGNLLNYTPNYSYWEEQYELVKQLNIVMNWKKKNNMPPVGKIYEKIVDYKLIYDECI